MQLAADGGIVYDFLFPYPLNDLRDIPLLILILCLIPPLQCFFYRFVVLTAPLVKKVNTYILDF